jgi:predicted methyltransferase
MRAMNRPSSLVLGLILVACGASSPAPNAPEAPQAKSAVPAGQTGHVAKVDVPASVKAVVDAPDRDAEDKELDAGRHAAEILAFLALKPGAKVAEIGAGGGYSTELLARAVGPSGVVYGQNSQFVLEKFADKPWAERLAKPVNKNVVKVTREFSDPLPPEAKDLDLVYIHLVYHDFAWMDVDRAKMNAAIFKALRPGGAYVIVDHSGRSGTGVTEVKSLHRIDEKVVRDEVEKAGFKLAAEADFLRNKADARDWNTAPFAAGDKRGTSDRFVLEFVKP